MKTILSWAVMFRTIRSGKNHNVGCSNKDLYTELFIGGIRLK